MSRGERGTLQTVRTYLVPWQADLARSLLESEGVEAFLADEHFARSDAYHSALSGGVRLLVRAEDASRALAALERAEAGGLALDAASEPEGPQTQEPPHQPDREACPRCGSPHLATEGRRLWFFGRRRRCRTCGLAGV